MDTDDNEVETRSAVSENKSYISEGNVILIKEFEPSSESSSYSDSSDDEAETAIRPKQKNSNEIATTVTHIQKLIRYLKIGNHTATILALACLKDEDLESDSVQETIRNTDGLQILVNLLEAPNRKCKIATLTILERSTHNLETARSATNFGVIPNIIAILNDNICISRKLSAEIIANVCRIKKSRKIVRKTGGLLKLVILLNIPTHLLKTKRKELDEKDKEMIDVVEASCKAIWAVSVSFKSKVEIHKLNAVKFFAKLLRSCHENIIVATLGVITQCVIHTAFRIALQNEGMIEDIVKYLSSDNDEIKRHCALTIYECAESRSTSNLVRQYGGLDPLVNLLTNERIRRNKSLLTAVTGAVWKCSNNVENIRRLDELQTMVVLIQLLNYENEEVLTNVAGAISECVKLPHNQEKLLKPNGIPSVLNLLNYTNENLLENVTNIVAECAVNPDCISQIAQNDGIRLLWSLLRSASPKVQASAARALVPCIQNAKDSSETIRSFAGGLELLINLLESNDIKVLSYICATITEVAKTEENLAIITDLGVINHLAKLVSQKNEVFRHHLASAIANCCIWRSNSSHFGKLNMVRPLVSYMKSDNMDIQRNTALALCRLSSDPYNCITLHRSKAVRLLLKTIASKDNELQEASAGCLSNIRNLALTLENIGVIQVIR